MLLGEGWVGDGRGQRVIILFMPRICIYPRTLTGGVGTFLLKFSAALRARGVEITHDLDDRNMSAVLLLSGTRHLAGLWRARRRGVPVIQRLDGINWVQRARWSGLRYLLRAEYGNANQALIRARLADRVIYQSEFTRRWWEEWYGPTRVPSRVILNGVDLTEYSPDGPHERPADRFRILLVEGSLTGGMAAGLVAAVNLSERLAERHALELFVAGRVDERRRAALERRSRVPLRFLGVSPRERIPQHDRSAHALFSAEFNPPCPNSVIEALACGLPVIGFDTGSLAEIVVGDAGRLAPYGGDPWRLDPPDVAALAQAAIEVLADQPRFRKAARARAEARFGLEGMVSEYLQVLRESTGG